MHKVKLIGVTLLCLFQFLHVFTFINAEENTMEITIQTLDEDGNECTAGLFDVNDTYQYQLKYGPFSQEEQYVEILQRLPNEATYIQASHGGVVTVIDDKKWIRWILGTDESDYVNATFQVSESARGKQIDSMAMMSTYDIFHQIIRTTEITEISTYIWNQPNISITNQNGESINAALIERDETAYFWVGVTNPTNQTQKVKVISPVDRRIASSVQSITDNGVMEGTDVIWNLTLNAKETKMIGYALYVPKLENDLFLYAYADVEFIDLVGTNHKQTNTVNFTLGHQVGLDEDFTIQSGKEKTIINQNREAQRIIEKQKQIEEAQKNAVLTESTVVRRNVEKASSHNLVQSKNTSNERINLNQSEVRKKVNTGGRIRAGKISMATGISLIPLFLFFQKGKRRE